MQCWCGNENLVHFGAGYHRCDACQTLVAGITPRLAEPRVTDDAIDLYGRDYWFDHQTRDLGCPDIVARSRTDLSERCVHWLRSLLQFKLPPARVLEIGCAHGGFVAMLRQAGFHATGLELSPSIVDFATGTFGVPVLSGPIEDQSLDADSFDAIVMMDVMEHLPQPLRTLGRCLELLKPDGILLIQTPGYPAETSLGALRAIDHKFPNMLDPNEHPFLFSRDSARRLFNQLGATHLEFIPAIFDFYDMSFVVSRTALHWTKVGAREAALASTISGRFMQALLDLDDRRLNLLRLYREQREKLAPVARTA